MSERRACRLVNQPRGTQRYQVAQREDEDALTQAIVELASQYGRYGYRRITALLKRDGWQVGKDRVERIWRREGLKVPQRQKPRGRLWFNDGSCVRLRPEHANHAWSYDFVSARTHDGRTVRMLNLIDEHSRECLMIRPAERGTLHLIRVCVCGKWYVATRRDNIACCKTHGQRIADQTAEAKEKRREKNRHNREIREGKLHFRGGKQNAQP